MLETALADRSTTSKNPVDSVDFQHLFLRISPRNRIRVDSWARGEWQHEYLSRHLPEEPPAAPWAVMLTDDEQQFRLPCFDLDPARGDVGPDLATLLKWLEEADAKYVVAASGSAGGRHVWVTANEPVDPALIKVINRAACDRLPTLDKSPLSNSKTGAVRAIGAPHRDGGRSELLSPLDERRAADILTRGNSAEVFDRLLLIIDETASPERVEAVREPVVDVVEDAEGPRLPGTPNSVLDDATWQLLTLRPPEDQVSEVCTSLLTKLALRRWTWPMVRHLLDDGRLHERGLLHVCTTGTHGTTRHVLDEEERTAKLARQWARCVDYAATLPLTQESLQWSENISDVVEQVTLLQQAADACPERWASGSGPADRAMLDQLCLLALRAGTLTLSLDARRAGLAIGHGRSSAHRSLTKRLLPDGWIGTAESNGRAATYELMPLTPGHPAYDHVAQGGTQGTPPPHRAQLIKLLQDRLGRLAADVFAHGRAGLGHRGGLGHHTARTYQALAENGQASPLTVPQLADLTGYTQRTVKRHLSRMQNLMMVSRAVMTVHHECPRCQAAPGQRCQVYGKAVARIEARQQHAVRQALATARKQTPHYRTRSGSLTAAAKAMGSHGRGAERARVYAAEVEAYRWWEAELEWMRSPKKGVRTGPRTHEDQAALVVTTLPRQPRRRYPRTPDGRADHQTALHRMQLRLAATA